MEINLPTVTDDFDGQCMALDAAIREAAENFQFHYTAPTVTFLNDRIPDLVYRLIRHYSSRGFTCVYDGEGGLLTIDWSHPNMTWQEQHEITRSVPTMIPEIGIAFRAALVYLCQTNGNDLRSHTDYSVQGALDSAIKEAATLGNLEISFGFPGVPAPAVQNLFQKTFTALEAAGFDIVYSSVDGLYYIKWGQTMFASGRSGENTSVFIGVPP